MFQTFSLLTPLASLSLLLLSLGRKQAEDFSRDPMTGCLCHSTGDVQDREYTDGRCPSVEQAWGSWTLGPPSLPV